MGSRSNNSTASNASNSVDNRQVNDAGGGIAGSGNFWDQSTDWTQQTTWTQTTNNADNRTTSNSGNTAWDWAQTTNNSDSRSTSNSGNTSWTQSDSGNTTWTQDTNTSNSGNTTWNWSTTDGGAIKGMSDVALAQNDLTAKLAKIAADNANAAASAATGAAIKAQEGALSTASAALTQAMNFASGTNAQAYKSNADAIGLVYDGFNKLASMTGNLVTGAQKQADSAASTVQAAYSSAASQANGNKTLTLAALAVVGVIGAVLLIKKA